MSNKMSNKMSNSNYHELQEYDSSEDNIPIAIPVPDNLSNNICKICFNDTEINDFIILRCNHKLCKDCFQKWHKTCPWCRENIDDHLKITNLDKTNNINNSDTCTDSTCKLCINVAAILSGISIIVIMFILRTKCMASILNYK